MSADECGEKRGTYAGWNVHNRQGLIPCRDCSDAQAAYMRHRRLTTWKFGRQVLVGFPTSDTHGLIADFDGIGAVIARSLRESA